MNKNSKRNMILSAASGIVKNQGVEKLTLETVAKEAGVSKGVLLHHFPNKEALIRGMMEELTGSFVSGVQTRAAGTAAEKGKWSRAYVGALREDIEEKKEIGTAISAALFTNPELLEQLRNEYSIWQRNAENDGIDPVNSTIVRLAVDGLWYSEMFGLGKLDDELRQQVIEKLIEMTK